MPPATALLHPPSNRHSSIRGQKTYLHGATGSPDSFILPAHSGHISISSQMRKQESQTSLRQMGHWLKRSLASCPAGQPGPLTLALVDGVVELLLLAVLRRLRPL